MKVNAPGISSRSYTGTHTVTRFHANIEWFVPTRREDGSTYTGWIKCTHDHKDEEAAFACQRRLGQRIRTNPQLFPAIWDAMQEANKEEQPS